MKFVTAKACESWLTERSSAGVWWIVGQSALPTRRFNLSANNGPCPAVVESSWIPWVRVDRTVELLVWVYEFGVWESNVDWNLYYRWRSAMGDSGTLADSPGHICLPHEAPDAASLINMSLCFGWGVRVLNPTWERAIQVNHDRQGVVIARTDQAFDEAPQEFAIT